MTAAGEIGELGPPKSCCAAAARIVPELTADDPLTKWLELKHVAERENTQSSYGLETEPPSTLHACKQFIARTSHATHPTTTSLPRPLFDAHA